MTALEARAVRFGVLTSMLRIRKALMIPGEWEDPGILPLAALHRKLVESGGQGMDREVINLATHEHSLRWSLKSTRRAA